MNKATQEIFHFAEQVDNLKKFIMSKKLTHNEISLVFSNDKISALVLYYVFLNLTGLDAFKMEIEIIDDIVGKHSKYNAERLKAMTSILKSDKVFTDALPFNIMIECFNDLEITTGTLEPYSASEIAWTCANILGIWGSSVFSFTGDAIRYIKACLEWEHFEMPPIFLSFPKILDMYPTDKLNSYNKVTKMLEGMSLDHIAKLGNDRNAMGKFQKVPYLLNYMSHCSIGAKELVDKINKTNNQLKTIFS